MSCGILEKMNSSVLLIRVCITGKDCTIKSFSMNILFLIKKKKKKKEAKMYTKSRVSMNLKIQIFV